MAITIVDVNDGTEFTFKDRACQMTSSQIFMGPRNRGYIFQDNFNHRSTKLTIQFMDIGQDFVLFVLKAKNVNVAIKFKQEVFKELLLQWRG